MRSSIRIRLVFAAFGVVALVAPAPVLAAAQSTTITMSVNPQTQDYGASFTLHATVTANGPAADGTQPHGTVTWYRYYSYPYYDWPMGSAPLAAGETEVSLDSYGLPPGENLVYARFVSDSAAYVGSVTGVYTVTVGPAPSTTTLTGPTSWELHDYLTLTAQTQSSTDEPNGSISFYRVGSATALCTLPIRSQDQRQCTFQVNALGTFGYYAVYSGGPLVTGSTSDTWNVTTTADLVHAHAIATQYTTFYPVTDGYRDTVKISGVRDETASATIKIYSPGGTLLKTVSIASGTGSYSYTWNGRNSAGTIYAEGKYKVVQKLTDSFGATLTSTLYTSISKKKLYAYTKTITKLGSSLNAKGAGSGSSVTVSTTYGYAKLSVPNVYLSSAGAGWELTLPSATVYNWFYVRVYGRHAGALGGYTRVGAQNFSTCAYASGATWYESCASAWEDIDYTTGTTKYYYRTPGLTSSYRSGTKVRVMVVSTGGTTYIYKAELRVSYSILKY